MRTYVLVGDEDVSGVSGVGVVAEVVEFSSGKVAIAWQIPYFAIEVHDTIESVRRIHGHGGKTRLVPSASSPRAPSASH